MKIKTVLVASLAGGIGYVLGTKAGTGRYEEIKAKADQLAKSPQVQDTVANLAGSVKKGAAKLPDPVADVVTSVADLATGSGSTDEVAAAARGAAESAADAASDAAGTVKDKAGDAADGVKDKAGDAADSVKKEDDVADPSVFQTDTIIVAPVTSDVDDLDLATLDELTTPDDLVLGEPTGVSDMDRSLDPLLATDPLDEVDPLDTTDLPPRNL